MKLRITVYSFMILLLAAHLSRANLNIPAVIVLFIPLLLFIRKSWVIFLLQGVGYLASIAWLFSTYNYVQLRISAGEDWIRLAFILGAIVIFTSWSSFFLRCETIDKRYGL